MFSNQISRREFLHNNNERITDNESFSQLQNSQYDFTQQSSGSESQSQGRRMYGKYSGGAFTPKPDISMTSKTIHGSKSMADPACFQPQATFSAQRQSSFQQKILMNKVKVKEKEDRDVMNSIIQTVTSCSDELKGTLKAVEENIGEAVSRKIQKSQPNLDVVIEIMEQKFKKMQDVIKENEDKNRRYQNMQEEISKRDSTIADLQKRLARERDAFQEELLNRLSEMIQTRQASTEQKLQQLLTMTKDQVTSNTHMIQVQEDSNQVCNKMAQDVKRCYDKMSNNLGNRLHKEFSQLRDELDKQKEEIIQFYQMELHAMHQKQSREVERHISQGLEKSSMRGLHKVEEISRAQTSQIQHSLQLHHDNLKSYFKEQYSDYDKPFQDSNQNNPSCSTKNFTGQFLDKDYAISEPFFFGISQSEKFSDSKPKMESALQKDNRSNDEGDKLVFCDVVPPEIQAKLTAMHKKHMEEKERLTREIAERERSMSNDRGSRFQNVVDCSGDNFLTMDYGTSKSLGSNFKDNKASSNFKSPGFRDGNKSAWTSNLLFGKTNPSPVAAVKPQPQRCEPQKMEISQSDSRRDGTRQRAHSAPQRRSQRLANSRNNSNQEVPNLDNSLSQFSNDSQQTQYNHQYENRNNVEHMELSYQSMRKRKANGQTGNQREEPIVKASSQRSQIMNMGRTTGVLPSTHLPSQSPAHMFRSSQAMKPQHRTFEQRSHNAAKSSVYDFKDENSPKMPNLSWPSNSMSNYPYDLFKPERAQSTAVHGKEDQDSPQSRDSSPSLSVTKIFIKRKQRNRTPLSPVNSLFGKYKTYQAGSHFSGRVPHINNDVFSSPEILDIASPTLKDKKRQKVSCREEKKYKQYHDEYLEINQTIRKAPRSNRWQ